MTNSTTQTANVKSLNQQLDEIELQLDKLLAIQPMTAKMLALLDEIKADLEDCMQILSGEEQQTLSPITNEREQIDTLTEYGVINVANLFEGQAIIH